MGKKQNKRDHKNSSGLRKLRAAGRAIRRLTMKINRWKRYQSEIENNKRHGFVVRWNVSGLERHIKFLEAL